MAVKDAIWRNVVRVGLPGLLLLSGCLGASAQIRMPSSTPSVPPAVGRGVSGTDAPAGDTADKSDLMDGTDVEALASEIRNLGYQAKTVKLNDDSIGIDSASSGVKFRISRYSCTEPGGPCSVDLGATWLTSKKPLPLTKLNEWNAEYRFGKAYNDSDGDLIFRMYLTFTGGVTKANFKANFERWISILAEFDSFRQKT